MKPSLVAIFAHPDDEAFGPGGTLKLYSETHDVYIICATRGDAGQNSIDGDISHTGRIREQELRNSARIIGAKDVFFLDYKDGCLCNQEYHNIVKDVRKITDELKPEILLTYENRGVSGHLDHVAMSMITHYIFHHVDYAKMLLSYCLPRSAADDLQDYFIYVPHGYSPDQIDKIVDVTSVWDKKIEALNQHKSQMKDVSRMLKRMETMEKKECFLMHTKHERTME